MQKLEDFELIEHMDDNAINSTYKLKDNSEMDNDHGDVEDDYVETEQ